ncbi:Embryonic stem cell-specific 5-hydroxymethylcytosine-binding protein [Quillaja saponaria]|uniref:Embryonic stem cell-specific 5-hydroxymethylcytosine-binding protein n=1 Tax=Quillaja saponaria TaxID=32244 RepID=A0AAD7LPC9_QUISA|nr:Embryonic stem cell-specific 5-hydroxymethylcytosine-binding protein [Quillaja saponaria]
MCGRGRCTLRADDIPRACYRSDGPVRTVNMDRYRPSYNVSPGSNLPVVLREDGPDCVGHVLHCMKWGLIPSFTKKNEKPNHYRMFNARSESLGEKASFRRLVPKSRCLVAAEGFYEWKKDGSKKQPYYIHFKDGRPLVFAALYDSWKDAEGERLLPKEGKGCEILYTFTILTTSSSSALQWLHDRMPVILGDKGSTDTWLNSSSKLNMLLKPYEESDLVWYPVSPAMGKASFDGPECIKEIQLKTEVNNSISDFFSTKGVKRGDSNKTDLPENLKEEREDEKEDHDPKSIVSTRSQEDAVKCQIKRDYEEFTADSKLAVEKTDQVCTSPLKKKGNLKTSGDKQPTLLSYFGKS